MNPPIPLNRPDPGLPATERARILVVDDDRFQHRILGRLLAGEDLCLEFASSGPEALRRFQLAPPDLVVLDVNMPGMDGFETCRRLRELPGGSETPILFLTGDDTPDTHDLALLSGGDDFLQKPIGLTELVLRVRSLLRIKHLQRDLAKERDDLLGLQARKDQLLQFLVHDLKNPLQGILACTELALLDEDLGARALEHVQGAQRSAETLLRMVLDLLEVEAAVDLEPQLEPLDARELLDAAALAMEARARMRGQALTLQAPEALMFHGDQALLHRALLNLVENALKYGPRDCPVDLEAQDLGPTVALSVRDRGPGIPPEQRERIFDPFFRLERDANQGRLSHGLGLASCRMTALAHRGAIRVEDPPGGGARFLLLLPKAPPARD